MRDRKLNGRCLAVAAVIVLALGMMQGADAQSASGTVGDSASLSSGAPMIAPTTVDPGQSVNVVVDGAPAGARIQLWGPVSQAGRGAQQAEMALTGGTAQLTAPDVSGSYELRYVNANGRQLGRRAFDVAATPVVLQVQTPMRPRDEMEVTWQGPARPGDRFEIVSGAGAVVDAIPVDGNYASANVSRLKMPAERGAYTLRYVTGAGTVLRTIGFDVR